MEFRDAMKAFRSELGLAQTHVAEVLHISAVTVGRWERERQRPVALLQYYAKSKAASQECYANLEQALDDASKCRLLQQKNSLFSVEHASVSQLLEEAYCPVYVCDNETYDILYIQKAGYVFGRAQKAPMLSVRHGKGKGSSLPCGRGLSPWL